ncbi:MAG: NAD(P)-dependent alcohol dehydrogenase [Chloroflexi bacterium]|nr:NAD(P)-dependent alcohol dehydrogenase [Chloroflexota bacterium]
MKAARIQAYGQPLVLQDIPIPAPRPGQVLVRVRGAGICRSDLHVLSGEIPILPRMPVTLGHENAGFVAAAGPGVTGVREGDAVAVCGGWGCGRCDYCVVGDDQLCATPSWAGLSACDGGYAEYLLVPNEKYLVRLHGLDPRGAAPLTDAALTPYRAIKRALPYFQPDHGVLVIGCGGLGQYGIKLLRILAGSPIIAVDLDPAKRQIAICLGAAHALDASDPETAARILELSGGGVAAAFDFVGSEATLALAAGSTRSGGKVTQVGLAGGEARLRVRESIRWEVAFEATLWGNVKELREVVALAESGLLTPIEVEYATLDRINEVCQRLERGEVKGRVVVTP